MYPNLLKFKEHPQINFNKTLKFGRIVQIYNLNLIFWREYMWSPEQWFETTELANGFTILIINLLVSMSV